MSNSLMTMVASLREGLRMAIFEAGDPRLESDAIALMERLSTISIMIREDTAEAVYTGEPMRMDAVRELGKLREDYYTMIEKFLKE